MAVAGTLFVLGFFVTFPNMVFLVLAGFVLDNAPRYLPVSSARCKNTSSFIPGYTMIEGVGVLGEGSLAVVVLGWRS